MPSSMLEIRKIVNGVLLHENKVLLTRRSLTRKTYAGCWSFPGGHVERSESLEQALYRELREEIGVAHVEYSLVAELVDPVGANTMYYLYGISRWAGSPAIQDHEHTELKWFPLLDAASIDGLALAGYRRMFEVLARDRR